MILGIEILCNNCGAELEITDVTGDLLLKVTIKTRPCKKCSRPSDCQLFCEDVLDREKELIAFREQIVELEKDVIGKDAKLLSRKQNIGVLQEKISTLASLVPIEEDENDDEDSDWEDEYNPG